MGKPDIRSEIMIAVASGIVVALAVGSTRPWWWARWSCGGRQTSAKSATLSDQPNVPNAKQAEIPELGMRLSIPRFANTEVSGAVLCNLTVVVDAKKVEGFPACIPIGQDTAYTVGTFTYLFRPHSPVPGTAPQAEGGGPTIQRVDVAVTRLADPSCAPS